MTSEFALFYHFKTNLQVDNLLRVNSFFIQIQILFLEQFLPAPELEIANLI